jgi:ligand-binding SRPBCC domain-containing protein
MIERFESRQWTAFPVELVFAFFANPSNLPHLMPPGLKMRVEDARIAPPPPRPVADNPERRFQSLAAGVGSEILISFYPFRWFPRRASWTARVTEFVWNSHFVDEQAKGLFTQFRHRHGIQAETRERIEGTLVSDEIEFALPYRFLGQIGDRMVRRQLERWFAHRREVLPKVLEAATRQAVRRK